MGAEGVPEGWRGGDLAGLFFREGVPEPEIAAEDCLGFFLALLSVPSALPEIDHAETPKDHSQSAR